MTKKVYYSELESLRGLAALMVFMYHIKVWCVFKNVDCINFFNSFVDFFFVLSGFVIALNFSRKIVDGNSYKVYIVKRFFRLYPLFIVTSIPFFIASILKTYFHSGAFNTVNYFSVSDFLFYITLTFRWGFVKELIFNTPTWSISVELFLYLLSGFLFLLKRTKKVNVLINLILVLISLGILIIFSIDNLQASYVSIFKGIYSFFLGGIIYYAFVENKESIEMRKPSSAIKHVLFFASTAAIITIFYFTKSYPVITLVLPLLYSAIIYVLITNRLPTFFIKFLNLKYIVYLGTISYSFYLTHLTMIVIIEKLLKKTRLEANIGLSILAIFITLTLTIVTSMITYKYIEIPGKELYKKFGLLSFKKQGTQSRSEIASAKKIS